MKDTQTESQIQSDFFRWIDLMSARHGELRLFYAIPNGANKTPATAAKFRREGLRPGVPDTHLPLRSADGKNGLWIEFKSKRGVLSDAQNEWITFLRLSGHQVEICRSWTDAAQITIDYLGLPVKL